MVKKNQGIQLLRVCSCLAVFVCHFFQRISMFVPATITDFFQLGKYGVELFFIISGYLVCNSVKKNYYRRRIIRIFPLYYFSIFIFFLAETFFFHDLPADSFHLGWVRYLLCLNGILPYESYYWSNIGITWTIPVFVYFYLFVPFLLKYMKDVESSIVSIVSTLIGLLMLYLLLPGWFGAFYYFPCFMLGILAYYIREEKDRSIFTILFIILYMIFHFFEKRFLFLEVYSMSFLFVIMVLYSDKISFSHHRLLDLFDDYTYTIYLVHGMVFCLCIDKFQYSFFVRCFIMLIGTFDFSYIIHEYYEKIVRSILIHSKE